MSILERIFHRKELKALREENRELNKTKIVLTRLERIMLLDALCCDEYLDKVSEPKNTVPRIIYKGVKVKLAKYIKDEE